MSDDLILLSLSPLSLSLLCFFIFSLLSFFLFLSIEKYR